MAGRAWFWNLIAKRYAKSPVADQAAYEKKLTLTRACFEPAMRVLEFGSGTGTTAVALSDGVASYRAVDISRRMVEIAEGRAREAGRTNLRFEVGALEDVESSQGFDAVLAMNVLHLVPDRVATIAAVHERLEEGGVFVSTTPCLAGVSFWLRWFARLGGALGVIPRVSLLSGRALKRELCDAGFEIETEWRPDPGIALFLIARRVAERSG